MDHLCCFVYCVSHAFASVHYCLVVTNWERADLLALIGDVYCIFVTFSCGTLVQVWYLIVSFPDICRLSYFQDQLSLNAGRKYCRKHSAINLAAIKLPFVIKYLCLVYFEWPFYTGFTVHVSPDNKRITASKQLYSRLIYC